MVIHTYIHMCTCIHMYIGMYIAAHQSLLFETKPRHWHWHWLLELLCLRVGCSSMYTNQSRRGMQQSREACRQLGVMVLPGRTGQHFDGHSPAEPTWSRTQGRERSHPGWWLSGDIAAGCDLLDWVVCGKCYAFIIRHMVGQ